MGEIWGCLVVAGHRWSEWVALQRASHPLYRWENQDSRKFAKQEIEHRLLSGAASLPGGKRGAPRAGWATISEASPSVARSLAGG